jgi:hypothetical protein
LHLSSSYQGIHNNKVNSAFLSVGDSGSTSHPPALIKIGKALPAPQREERLR